MKKNGEKEAHIKSRRKPKNTFNGLEKHKNNPKTSLQNISPWSTVHHKQNKPLSKWQDVNKTYHHERKKPVV